MKDSDQAKRDLLEYKMLLEKQVGLQEGLPHLYGWPWYPWAREFFESVNKFNFLCAANQISKSSTQIRKCIDWATNKRKWPQLWKRQPIQFWYLYPTKDIATQEFETKWVPEFLPSGKFKEHELYGWKVEYESKKVHCLKFNSGVTVYFKTYAQDVQHLQAGSVDAVFGDEELPFHLYSELVMRLSARDGYFHMVFTATLGQEEWRRTMEERGTKEELFPQASKWQVSMYDCQKYEDGSDSPWTTEKIQRVINGCGTQNEVLRRVFGRFVVDEGLKYPAFDRTKNVIHTFKFDKTWKVFSGVDIGGGGSGHPSAISFIAVRPDMKYGVVFKAWRGDGKLTTAGDVLDQYRLMRGRLHMTAQYYDYHAKDFYTIACRQGEAFLQAEKSHEVGEETLNVLFKNKMLDIYVGEDSGDTHKLVMELSTLKKSVQKRFAADDCADSLRYGITKIGWDWSAISANIPTEETQDPYIPTSEELRRGYFFGNKEEEQSVEQELDEWNDLYG